jgi:hypothetical protein
MLAKFFENKSDERYMNKALELKYDNIPIEILNPSSIEEPTIKVSTGLIGQNVNYVWLSDLERYYFIRSWNFENGYITLICEEDYLYSHKNEIYRQNVIVSRNETLFDRYLEDDRIKVRNYDCIRTLQFPHGFESLNIILGVVGKTTTSNS